MKNSSNISIVFLSLFLLGCARTDQMSRPAENTGLTIVDYNNPDAVSDLGVGLWAWPVPMDFDQDGDMDLLVSCPDKPFNGIYFFENTSGDVLPVFAPPVRLGDAIRNIQLSYVDGKPRVLIPGAELFNFRDSLDRSPMSVFSVDSILKDFEKNPRFNQWKMVDYENDGDVDIIVGVDDWSDYGWDNAYNAEGKWTNGPLHGYLYLIENTGDSFLNRGRIKADGKEIDVYGAPSPNFSDFDGDGDLDIICGEFLDKLTWFENIGTREKPRYAEGRVLTNQEGIIKMDLEMIVPIAVDWDNDGDDDLVVGDEDGRVALIRNSGRTHDRMPVFESPVYFQQQAQHLKFGALVTPVSVDWDGDGDEDIIAGNSAGYVGFIENVKPGNRPVWNPPVLLKADGEVIRIQAGDSGSIQGPAEAKWGYTTLTVADWDGDGLLDIVLNSIWGRVEWFKNAGTKGKPSLVKGGPVKVLWESTDIPKPAWNWWDPGPQDLVAQWRTTPFATDWNKDGLTDLIMLDHEGFLTFFERTSRDGALYLLPGKRIFYCENSSGFDAKSKVINENSGLLQLNTGEAGRSGRRKFTFMDWDADGDLDLVVNSESISLFENTGESEGRVNLVYKGLLSDQILAGHTTSPTFADWNENGILDVIVGAEDGHLYYLER